MMRFFDEVKLRISALVIVHVRLSSASQRMIQYDLILPIYGRAVKVVFAISCRFFS